MKTENKYNIDTYHNQEKKIWEHNCFINSQDNLLIWKKSHIHWKEQDVPATFIFLNINIHSCPDVGIHGKQGVKYSSRCFWVGTQLNKWASFPSELDHWWVLNPQGCTLVLRQMHITNRANFLLFLSFVWLWNMYRIVSCGRWKLTQTLTRDRRAEGIKH